MLINNRRNWQFYHGKVIRHEQWGYCPCLSACESADHCYHFGKYVLRFSPRLDWAIDWDEAENTRKTLCIWAVVKYFIAKRYIWQQVGGVIDFVYRESHQLKPPITWQNKRFTVNRWESVTVTFIVQLQRFWQLFRHLSTRAFHGRKTEVSNADLMCFDFRNVERLKAEVLKV